jgi:hypothetical protein
MLELIMMNKIQNEITITVIKTIIILDRVTGTKMNLAQKSFMEK